ncbi:MAG: raffinose/stachyose/melibiose transport system permease protein [Pseudonocardiales bacterium]|nr:raffinose/stachyose/melibiose transport system permease protein [Pseudonocardiales bacterium]
MTTSQVARSELFGTTEASPGSHFVKNSRRAGRGIWIATITAYLVTFVVMLPLLWILLLSFRSSDDILSRPFSVSNLTTQNYKTVVDTLNLMLMYRNTFILAVVSVVVGLVVSFMAAFALTRMVFRRRRRRLQKWLRYYFLAGLAVPVYILLFPVYRLDLTFHLFGTYAALILPYIAISIPFNILLLTGFLVEFPEELEQAAIIDGVGLFSLCTRVVLPLMRPVIATLLILNIIYVWNEFPFAVTLINKSSLTTLPLGVSQFQGVWSTDYGAEMAAAALVLVPQLVVFAVFQRQVIEGMTLGAVKG